MEPDGTDLAPLNLVTGDDEGADEDGVVSLSSTGAGEVRYTFDTEYLRPRRRYDEGCDADDNGNGTPAKTAPVPQVDDDTTEWNNVEITFTWEAGEPPLDMGTVTVSYDPVSDDVKDIPRFASGPTNDVITIEDCTTTLLFPYVTNQSGFDTGLVITNTSEGSGSCTIGYSGPDAPDDMMTPEPVAGGEQWVNLLSNIAPDSRAISLQAVNFGMRTALPSSPTALEQPHLAQGYLAVCTNCD